MKCFRKLIITLIIILLALDQQGQASDLKIDSLGREDSKEKQAIILIDVLQPLIFGKVGVGFGWRNISHEYVIYGNYVFGKKLLPTTAFKVENNCYCGSANNFNINNGFDVGVQIKKRSELPNKPYVNYINDASKVNSFYHGAWFEISKKNGSSEDLWAYYSYSVWEFMGGGLAGWSIESQKPGLFYDISAGVGVGRAYGEFFTKSLPNTGNIYSYSINVNSFILMYKINIQIGFKL